MKPSIKHKSTRNANNLISLVFILVAWTANAQLMNVANDATDPNNLGDTEPSIAVNPVNPLEIVITTFSEAWNATTGAPIWRSTDGGITWNKIFILPRPGASTGPGDQKIQFDRNGNLLIAELAGGIALPRCVIFRQTGLPGTNLTAGAFYGDDQPMLNVDNNPTSPFVDRTYSAWLNFGVLPEVSTVARSIDDGNTVNNVAGGDNANFANRTTRSTVAPDGSAYIIFKTREGNLPNGFESAHFVVKRSDDGGVNWNALGQNGVSVHGAAQVQTWFTTSWGNPARGKVGRARSSDAWIASDPSDGDIYAVYCDQDASGFGQIFLARSTNRGATWTTTRVTDGTHHNAYPEIAVADNGTIGVLYIDFDDAGTTTLFRHRFSRSFNNGTSWTDEILQSMDPGPITNANSGFLWGDYEGLTAHGFQFYGVFTGESTGRTTLQLDPIFFSRTALSIITDPFSICVRRPWLCNLPVLDKNLIKLKCLFTDCKIFDPLPKNCLIKYNCPGCSPAGLCPPPFFIIKFWELDKAWTVRLIDPLGKEVKTKIELDKGVTVLTFKPEKQFMMKNGILGNYNLVFSLAKEGVTGKEYNIRTTLEASDKPFMADKK